MGQLLNPKPFHTTYDGEGKRVKKVTYDTQGGSEATVFVYSAGKLVAEYSNTQVPVTNPTTRYLTEDHLGTPRVITDSEGNVISRRDFLPFGEQLDPDVGGRSSVTAYQPTNDNVKQKFTGYQKDDESGLDFAEARMYENRHGRFTAVDPLLASGKSANPQTFNRYVYCVSTPLACTDPSGLDGERWYSTTDPDELKKKCNNQCTTFYQAFEENPGEAWNEVSFENRDYHVISGSRIGTQYLYADGTSDGGTRARWFDEWASFTQATRDYCRIDPKCIALRDPQVRDGTSAAMWAAAPFYNGFAGTYNLGAWGANQWTPTKNVFPYAPVLSPDERTSDGGQLFYYGTNAALLAQGGYGLYGYVRSVVTRFQAGGTTFGQNLFLSERFGVTSNAFGNSFAGFQGSANVPGRLIKAGWSNTPANGGGMVFRIGILRNPINASQSLKHFELPKTFVPNSFANPSMALKRALQPK